MQPIHVTIPANSAAGASTPLVRLDPWSIGDVSVQIVVTGTVNYTLQTTFDDPNDPTGPIMLAGNMVWFDAADPAVVKSTKNALAKVSPTPLFARILLNSGAGSLRATFIQTGVVNY